jgi:SAM-dependent methyltransferase
MPAPNSGADASACPVCCDRASRHLLLETDGLTYFACGNCEARYLDPRQHPSLETERAHYCLHENDPGDSRYRAFLARLADPLLAKLEPSSHGLDYGCGPGPTLSVMLAEKGHQVALYDPFFYSDKSPLDDTYDFITCTEAIEHFHHPAEEFERFDRMLSPGGWLAIMTCFQTDDRRFANWHYRKDPTHVVFYRVTTLSWIAKRHGWSFEVPRKDVALMQKPQHPSKLDGPGCRDRIS